MAHLTTPLSPLLPSDLHLSSQTNPPTHQNAPQILSSTESTSERHEHSSRYQLLVNTVPDIHARSAVGSMGNWATPRATGSTRSSPNIVASRRGLLIADFLWPKKTCRTSRMGGDAIYRDYLN